MAASFFSFWALTVLFVMTPGTAATVFRYFGCAKYDGDGDGDWIRVLRVDPTIRCSPAGEDGSGRAYRAWFPYVVAMLFVYPIGVPLAFAAILWRMRGRLNPDLGRKAAEAGADDAFNVEVARHRVAMEQLAKLEKRAGDPALEPFVFLYEDYEPRCYLFAVYEMFRRIFLTAALVMFFEGTISQIAVGLLGALISYRVYAHFEPYVEDDDDAVSEVAQTQLVLVFFYALMCYATVNIDEQHDGTWSGVVFTYILVVIFFSVLIVAVWEIVLAAVGRARVHEARLSVATSLSSLPRRLASRASSGRAASAAADARASPRKPTEAPF